MTFVYAEAAISKTFTPVYHVEKPRPFISPPYLYGHLTGYFTGNLRNFSKIP